MQTFLPYKDFKKSASVLDYRRLGKQRVESYTILKINLGLGKVNKNGKLAWSNHPAAKMWKGYEYALYKYTQDICKEWLSRNYKDSILQKLDELPIDKSVIKFPPWLGNEAIHSSHRSNLLRKDESFYNKYKWTESNDLPYVWPVE